MTKHSEFAEDQVHFDAAEGLSPRPERRCRKCRCTQNRACYHDALGPCWWVAADLCSHCLHRLNTKEIIAYFPQIAGHLVGMTIVWKYPNGVQREAEVRKVAEASGVLVLLINRHRHERINIRDVVRINPIPEE